MQGEITSDGVVYVWSVFEIFLTITAPDGRQKITLLGGSTPEGLGRIMARELAREAPKG